MQLHDIESALARGNRAQGIFDHPLACPQQMRALPDHGNKRGAIGPGLFQQRGCAAAF